MPDDKDVQSVTRANIEAWDEVAPIHERQNQEDLLTKFSDLLKKYPKLDINIIH